MKIINNTDYTFTPDQQDIINSGAANCGVDTVYTQQGSESVFNFYRDESFKVEYYLFSFDLATEDIIDMKPITVEGLDTIFVTGMMEDMERIAPILKSIGFVQIKDRPNAFEFKTGMNAPLGSCFEADPKITYMGMPISEETAMIISAALIEEVKLKIIS
jgi:hypothetical protein